MLEQLKIEVYKANMLLPRYNLVTFTWGNVSAIDRERGLVAIKPSGVEYDELKPEDIVIVDLEGNIIEGALNPSSDTATHLELYKSFVDIKSVVHTHSRWATIFSQAKRSVKPYGTTHADYFYGTIPVTRDMNTVEIATEYEKHTGKVIVETFEKNNIVANDIPSVLVASHGPFSWGNSAFNAVHNAVVLEELCQMAYYTQQMCKGEDTKEMSRDLLDKHYLRKHGANAYYGQK